jgi:hypothetical protein
VIEGAVWLLYLVPMLALVLRPPGRRVSAVTRPESAPASATEA